MGKNKNKNKRHSERNDKAQRLAFLKETLNSLSPCWDSNLDSDLPSNPIDREALLRYRTEYFTLVQTSTLLDKTYREEPKNNNHYQVTIKDVERPNQSGKQKRPRIVRSNDNSLSSGENQYEPTIIEAQVSWNDILFCDRSISIKYNGRAYSIYSEQSRISYNAIIKSFEQRLPPLRIQVIEKRATLLEPLVFNAVIELLSFKNQLENRQDYASLNISILKKIQETNRDVYDIFFPIDRSDYLDYLQVNQSSLHHIIPVFEDSHSSPDGFLFTLKGKDGYLIIWESINDSVHRATYCFFPKVSSINELHQHLFDYIGSTAKSKRMQLRQRKVELFEKYPYLYIDHDSFDSWKTQLVENLYYEHPPKDSKHTRAGVSNKAIKEVTYSKKTEDVSYISQHSIIQNCLIKILDSNSEYVSTLLEQDFVDLKATTQSGDIHYFEIKTCDNAKQCIREALGQILEYAFYSNEEAITKMYIVGPSTATNEDKKYLALLRQRYSIPIWYLSLDYNLGVIGAEC